MKALSTLYGNAHFGAYGSVILENILRFLLCWFHIDEGMYLIMSNRTKSP